MGIKGEFLNMKNKKNLYYWLADAIWFFLRSPIITTLVTTKIQQTIHFENTPFKASLNVDYTVSLCSSFAVLGTEPKALAMR